jgi:acetyltransferase-like isoleucine patch superfamily enzyme
VNPDRTLPHDWFGGIVPENVSIDPEAYVETTYSFQLFRSRQPEAVRIGRGTSIYLGVMFDLGPQATVRVGEFTLMNGSRIICDSSLEIGNHCLISWNTVLADTWRWAGEVAARRRALEQMGRRHTRQIEADSPGAPIRIADNVWIGFDSCIFPGVSIGEGSIVGARSVVTQDVPPFTIVAGNPARVIRQLEHHRSRPPASV